MLLTYSIVTYSNVTYSIPTNALLKEQEFWLQDQRL